ncbi:ABC transporter substrate-binding protein [Lachnotalea sp. AF33-28]|nr:ABC transporter substrate-binding protein [Lachnotalea sp. AF33-28]
MRRCAISRIAEFAVYEFTMDGLCIVMLINTLSCMKGCFVVSGQTFGGKNMKKLLAIILTCALAVSLAACSAPAPKETDVSTAAAETTQTTKAAETPETTQSAGTEQTAETSAAALPTTDPSGAQIKVPEDIETIAVLSPSIAQTIIGLGLGDKIAAYDAQSVGLEGLPESDIVLDFMQPDMEQLAALNPDVLFVSNMTLYDQENPYQTLIDQGVCVICVPTSESIAAIQSDISFLAAVLGVPEKGEAMLADMQAQIDSIAAIGSTITDKKTVYFEIAAAPSMYSFGSGVFLNEMIELIGAKNILADQNGWLGVEAETVVAANPDVILTNVNYIENPTQEIMDREGWADMTAVADKSVYYIDNMASSSSNQNIVKALVQMAEAIYPEYYTE